MTPRVPRSVRLLPEELELVEKAAALERRTVSDWLRLTALDAARRVVAEHEPPSPPKKPRKKA
jgi:uncharacterized protein (DUF1778 family)